MRSWTSRSFALAEVVSSVQLSMLAPSGSRQLSQRPAIAKQRRSGRAMWNGCFAAPLRAAHS
jgi:hypothetical protein